MKKKKIELDVDFIGGQDPLTLEEEKALTDFFRQRKATARKPLPEIKRRTTKRSKISKTTI